ncbi:DUF4861 family protein [Dysgonomonas macrotermitis]|uniref:DUF4861 domain-containing protein n=1 Tax=Dysgonomonas macrotermitis TaxID=1346286 RepID=A0A1M5GHY1_9BACT|nr:DUF4861 family protein [Dysgonomonas macrotermitis]SHG03360.1 protein of unknown function [Dysgonomonas macrotermitis]
MNTSALFLKKIVFAGLFLSVASVSLSGQNTSKEIRLKNNSSTTVTDYTLEIPVENLALPFGNYIAEYEGKVVPVEISSNIYNKTFAILPIDKIDANKELKITIKSGHAEAYPKRTYAELSHKIGGQFVGREYIGEHSWVKPNNITLPGSFTDHSYYIKYEGPGWESDKVAFRFYLDNRNAIDVFAKKTSEIVLPGVGIDGFSNYHNMAAWGMDNMKVGAGLGIGTIAVWNGSKAVRVDKKDSTTCLIPMDGKIRSQVKTIYYGWDANGTKCNLTSLISIDAGSRASHMELFVDKNIDNLATGIIKDKNAKLTIKKEEGSEWSYIATFGKQSLNKDMQGLVVFVHTKQIKQITEDELNHVLVLSPDNGYLEYYFMPTWELDKEPVKDEATFLKCIDEVLNRLNSKFNITGLK